MCGICGVVHFDGRPIARDALLRACETLRHRGPDHTGTWIDTASNGCVGIGATRLAVQDPTSAGHQPMQRHEDRYHLVFNGEIYNFRQLRQELTDAGENFTTNGDTEVVLAACVHWGTDALRRFNGMWALAFYDTSTRTGFLSRDRFGIKPLLYGASDRTLRFASELGAFSALGDFDRTVDADAVVQLLQFGYIAHPATIYQNARRLAPGEFLTFTSAGTAAPLAYYSLPGTAGEEQPLDYADACAQVRQQLSDAVVARRVSDVPIGAFLSGGLDSSIIVSHFSAVASRPIATFSVGYADQKTYDETRYARLVAQRFGTDHHELILTERDVLDSIPPLLDHLTEPVGDSSIIPTALLSKFAARFVTVALSGDGGDELFGGYWRYLGHDSLAAYQRIPSLIRRLIIEPVTAMIGASKSSALGNRARQFRKLLRERGGNAFARHVAWSRILSPEAESIFLDPAQSSDCDLRTISIARELARTADRDDPLNGILAFDLQHQLPADMLHKVDQASMMHSLEVRVPFLDPALVESVSAMPSRFKIDRGRRKGLLIDSYRSRLPDAILDRPKQGFEVPIGEYFRGPLSKMFRDIVTRDVVESFGLLSFPAIERVFEEHRRREGEHADVLFALLSLCWWRRRG